MPGRFSHGYVDCGTRRSRTVPAARADRTAGRGLRRPRVLRFVADPSELARSGHRHRARQHTQLPAHRHHSGRRRGGRRQHRASPPVASSRPTRRPATSRCVAARPRDRPARRGRPARAPSGRRRIRRPRTGAAGGVAHHHHRCRIGTGGRIAEFPVAVPAGLALAALVDQVRNARTDHPDHGRRVPTAPVQSLAVSAGVIGLLTAFAAAEHALAELAGTTLARALPGPQPWWRLTGHAAFLGALAIGGGTLFDHIVRGLEAGATSYEPVLGASVQPEWIGPTVSGGPDSHVAWATLGREGRRHAFAHVRAAPWLARPAGLPDLSIETVIGRPARATPVQVYVGLDSAPDARTRVALAMAELDRTDAWSRSLLMLISPTGTGYVNYCAVAATQYLTLGDVATVTLQYSKRPSPLSLGKIGAAREQNRLLMLRVLERLRDRPAARRPR